MPDDANSPDARKLRELLGKRRWFGGLPRDLQERILAGSRVRDFARGEVIGLEGHRAKAISAVIAGQVKLVRHAKQGDEALVYICEPGFWFGEYAVLTDGTTLVSAIAKTKVRLLLLPKHEFDRIVAEEPRYFQHFASLALVHAGKYLKAFVHGNSLDPAWRLRGQLTLLCELKSDEHVIDAPIDLPYAQAELASIVGVSRQTANALLHALANDGLIELGFKRIRVLKPGELLA